MLERSQLGARGWGAVPDKPSPLVIPAKPPEVRVQLAKTLPPSPSASRETAWNLRCHVEQKNLPAEPCLTSWPTEVSEVVKQWWF